MTIKEMEQLTGLKRSNIRFYEKEKLITPTRNESNGYREYTKEDAENIKKIAYLRTLGISIEEIHRILSREVDLYDVVENQIRTLERELSDLENAKAMCERMVSSKEKITYDDLDIEKYVTNPKEYWKQNGGIFRLDVVSFLYMWGRNIVWGIITIACLLAAGLSFRNLPAEIPVQWSGGTANSFADKRFIFAFPAACVITRFLLRPFIWRCLKTHGIDSDLLADDIVNFFCLVIFAIEIFLVLFVFL